MESFEFALQIAANYVNSMLFMYIHVYPMYTPLIWRVYFMYRPHKYLLTSSMTQPVLG